jgi:hypothetical protein
MNGTSLAAYFIIGGGFSGVFSQVPAIFALDATDESLQIGQRPAARFWSGKARSNPGMQMRESLSPSHNFVRGRLGAGEGDMLVLLHDLLLSRVVSECGLHPYRVSQVKEKIMKLFHGSEKEDYCSV